MRVVRATSGFVSDATRPVLMSSAVTPPTRGAKTSFDSPNVPWHDAHFASQTFCPCCTLPDPGGRPLKSGRTSMSHAAISAAVAGRPTPGYGVPAANVIPAKAGIQDTANAVIRLIGLDIGHFPTLRDLPRLNRVVVVDRARAAHGAQLVDLRLHVPGLIHRARLQDGGPAIPDPVDVEAREALGKHRRLELGRAPVASAVERHVDALHPAPARPREPRHVLEALVEQCLAARGRRDDRLALLNRRVLALGSIGHQVHVMPGLVRPGPGFVSDLDE